MVATNAVRPRTGNVSVGTSIFAMIVVEDAVANHPEIDPVTTPDGSPVAMVHCNNGAQELSNWIGLFSEVALAFGKSKIDSIDTSVSNLLRIAVNYYKNQRDELFTYLESGYLSIDNNRAERDAVKPFVIYPRTRIT